MVVSNFIMDDAEAVLVLAAYFPPEDNIKDEDRLRWAIEARRNSHSRESHAEAEQYVKQLIKAEAAEHNLLVTYWSVVALHIQSLRQSIQWIEVNCKDAVDNQKKRELWSYIILALNSCAAISRMFEASSQGAKTPKTRELRERRAELLMRATGRKASLGQYLKYVRSARNAVEHFEEYLDLYVDRAVYENKKIWDLQCVQESEVKASGDCFLRWYDNENKVIHVFEYQISLQELNDVAIGFAFVNTSVMLRGRYHPQWSFGLYG